MSTEDYIPPLYQDGNGNWVLLDSDGKKYHVATKDSRLGRAIAARTVSSAVTRVDAKALAIAEQFKNWTLSDGAGEMARELIRLNSIASSIAAWTPVSERLPEKDGEYLCVNDWDGDAKTAVIEVFLLHKGTWYDGYNASFVDSEDIEAYHTTTITHWMPLPSLPGIASATKAST